jgi:dienelactone hydrolase
MPRGGWATWLTVLALAGCAHETIQVPYRATPGPVRLARVVPNGNPFAYRQPPLVPWESGVVEDETDRYTVQRLAFPSVGDNGQDDNLMTARYYRRKGAGRAGLVIVLPIWGGHRYPPDIVAWDLAGRGTLGVLHVLGERTVLDWAAMAEARDPGAFADVTRRMVQRARVTVIDLRRVLDWAESRPEIDSRRIGIIGFSESNLQVAGLLASDDRVAAAVLVMGGAHPHAILATCYGPPEEVRRGVMRRFGWSLEQFTRTVEPLVEPIDAARLGSLADPEGILVLDAQHDDCIPAAAREALWNTLGRPARISVLSTHAGSFLGMTFLGGNHIRRTVAQFFARRLEAPPRRDAWGDQPEGSIQASEPPPALR